MESFSRKSWGSTSGRGHVASLVTWPGRSMLKSEMSSLTLKAHHAGPLTVFAFGGKTPILRSNASTRVICCFLRSGRQLFRILRNWVGANLRRIAREIRIARGKVWWMSVTAVRAGENCRRRDDGVYLDSRKKVVHVIDDTSCPFALLVLRKPIY